MDRSVIKRIPVISTLAIKFYGLYQKVRFPGSKVYWVRRYAQGGISGAGRYREFKAKILNDFVKHHGITTVIEYGCGDGNQLKLGKYPSYIGFDVSKEAINRCKRIFHSDTSKEFKLMREYDAERAELTLSLDVVYHLIEDAVFHSYMDRLFSSSDRFVIIYSTNTNVQPKNRALHVKHRKFTDWVEANAINWALKQRIDSARYFSSRIGKERFRDFFVYEKV